jgi:hypothetical protein
LVVILESLPEQWFVGVVGDFADGTLGRVEVFGENSMMRTVGYGSLWTLMPRAARSELRLTFHRFVAAFLVSMVWLISTEWRRQINDLVAVGL